MLLVCTAFIQLTNFSLAKLKQSELIKAISKILARLTPRLSRNKKTGGR
jgi:hypothetical protein